MTWIRTRHGFYWFAGDYTIATEQMMTQRGYALAFNDRAARRLVNLGNYPTLVAAKAAAVAHESRVS